MKTTLEKLFWIGLVLLALASVCAGFRNGLRLVDFQWLPVRILANGDNPYLYSLNNVSFMGCQVSANQVPSCLALLLPFAFLPFRTANAVWDVCNLVFTVVFFGCLWKLWFKDKLGAKWFWFVVCLTLTGTPWRVLIGNGQHLMFSLSFFFMAYYALQVGRKWSAGILLALALFKYTTVAPMCLIFLMKREWKVISVCAGVHIALTIGCGLYLSENPFELVVQSLKVGNMLVANGNADIASLLRWFGVVDVGGVASAGYAFCGLLGLTIAVRGRLDDLLGLAIFAVLSNVMFYHRIYDFVTLIFPIIYVVLHRRDYAPIDRAIRYLTYTNVIFIFFICKLFSALQFSWNTPITFVLEHALLVCLVWKSFDAKNDSSAACH